MIIRPYISYEINCLLNHRIELFINSGRFMHPFSRFI